MIRSSTTNTGGGDPPQDNIGEGTRPSSPRSQLSNINIKNDTTEDGGKELAKAPLCICPSCDKVLTSMKSLYGHFGRSHRTSIKQDRIKFLCPFCDGTPEEVFDSTSDLDSHVAESHPECTLLRTHSDHASSNAETPKQKSAPSSTSPTEAPERRRSSRHQADSKPSSKTKPPKRKYSHPLCKCPNCDKVLLPQGLFGHFGRVHSGQLGHSARFEWKNVSYACPFCPEDIDGGSPHIFRTIELAEAHVSSSHTNCHLTRPNALSNSPKSTASSSKPDVGSSSMTTKKKSQRSSRRSSIDAEGDDDDDADSSSSSPAVATRKSQRSRRSLPGDMISDEDNKRGAALAEEKNVDEEVKPLYNCPACEKTGLTKHGLHAHYGMKHGGSVDMSKVKMVKPKSTKKKEAVFTSRTGPWTDKEHNAFIEGHRKYGNRWKQISVEYVPTRDAKQIGSHALNFFTTRGEWQDTLGGRASGGSRGNQQNLADSEDVSPNEGKRRSKRENSGKPRHSLVGNVISTPMGVDSEEGGDSVSVESNVASDKEATATDGDDGNSSHCIVCFEGGNIVCCSKCPRAYHPKCLAKDGNGGVNVELLPNDWQCNRCKKDFKILVGEEISQYAFGNKKIRAAYAEFKDCSDYNYCCALLSNILDILTKLKNYDYGYVFSEPVDVGDVPDYPEVVKTPMDYGTVSERLEGGNYVDLIASDDISRDDENSTMEEILLHVLCDIERVHHNCHLYNKKGSSIYRIGDVHASKWNVYFIQYILERLPVNVERDLALFRHSCKLELEEGCQESRSKKKLQEAEKKVKSFPSISSTSANQKKRKASELLDEEESEDDEDMEDEEEDEQECQRKAKKAKQEESPGHSPALLFTEDQMRSLESVFFSSAAKLREEFDEMDVCSTLTSPQGSIGADNEDKNELLNPSASVGGGDGGGVGESGALMNAKSEESLHEHHRDVEVPSSAATTSPMIPELITSGPTMGPAPALPKSPFFSTPTSGVDTVGMDKMPTVIQSPNNRTSNIGIPNANAAQSTGKSKGTMFQRQWYERLNELKKYKVTHGTAVVSATKNDKLYHWRLRQRKRYHLTLFRMPSLKIDPHGWDNSDVDKKDKEWLLALPEMKGVFALSASPGENNGVGNAPKPIALTENDVEMDEKAIVAIRKKYQEQLYCQPLPAELLFSPHSSRHKSSLFWDECLEELRFFQGDHQHTIVPRDFPHNKILPVWVEIQRAKYLLQNIGLFSGLTGSQMFVLDELNLCDLSSLPTVDAITGSGAPGNAMKSPYKSTVKKIAKDKAKEDSSSERKSWSTHISDFKEWLEKLPPEDKPRASELLPRANWPLYSWCWRQCNASSAVLCGTPNISGISMSVRKLNTLALTGFFHAFAYNDRNGLVREDDYEGCDAFDSTFQVLEDFSIKYGSTHIPDWFKCDRAFRMWVAALENGLTDFVKGEPCVLSGNQIEKLILIGFCNDRDGLPNLSKSDVVWLKMFTELKRHRELFGVCNVSSDFPRLHQWLAEQKELFRLSRMGKKDMMNSSRLKMLMEVGVDFFTGECLPGEANLIQQDFEDFDRLTSSPVESFPVNGSATSTQTNYGWNFQYDNFWQNHDCRTKFEQFKAKNGHSLVLASDDEDVYWWFVEKRGRALLFELSSTESSQAFGPNELCSHSILRHVIAGPHDDGMGSDEDRIKVNKSMFVWLHYCERLLLFKAREGHCKIPKDYPDGPLRRWLVQQQELIHSYSINQSIELLPVQLKILHALGLHGKKRHGTPPKLSSRTLKRKYPSRKGKKLRDLEKPKK